MEISENEIRLCYSHREIVSTTDNVWKIRCQRFQSNQNQAQGIYNEDMDLPLLYRSSSKVQLIPGLSQSSIALSSRQMSKQAVTARLHSSTLMYIQMIIDLVLASRAGWHYLAWLSPYRLLSRPSLCGVDHTHTEATEGQAAPLSIHAGSGHC